MRKFSIEKTDNEQFPFVFKEFADAAFTSVFDHQLFFSYIRPKTY